VSQFAAGCAVCGFDLERARGEAAERGPSLADRAASLRPGVRTGLERQDLFLIAVMVALVVFFPIVGLALAAWTAYDQNRGGERFVRNVALGLVAVAVVFIAVPGLRYGIVGAIT
jgi:positive regulator of sigma E activity